MPGGPVLPPSPPSPPPSQQAGGTCTLKALDVIKQAMLEIQVLDPNEEPQPTEASTGLSKLNRMLDAWNADGRYVWAVQFLQFNLVPNLQPHTIGPTGTFVVNQRPVKIVDANIILNNGSSQNQVRCPVQIRDADWWASKRAYNIAGTLPTDCYYEPDWPNGSLYMWVIPQIAYPLELEIWTLINQLQMNSGFCLPPGYADAVIYSLAEALAPSFGVQFSPALMKLKTNAIQRIFGVNTAAPRLATDDVGIPKGDRERPYWNYLTGLSR